MKVLTFILCQQRNAFKSEASFRGPKTKLLAKRSQQSKRARANTKIERRKKMLKTSSDGDRFGIAEGAGLLPEAAAEEDQQGRESERCIERRERDKP